MGHSLERFTDVRERRECALNIDMPPKNILSEAHADYWLQKWGSKVRNLLLGEEDYLPEENENLAAVEAEANDLENRLGDAETKIENIITALEKLGDAIDEGESRANLDKLWQAAHDALTN